jgi:hypothetical protein
MTSITFVSQFFDIGRNQNIDVLSLKNYITNINKLLQLNINILFYTTKQLHDQLQYTNRANLKFIFLDQPPWYDRLDKVIEVTKNYQTGFKDKDTPQFMCITLGKFQLLKDAIALNPFDNKYYAWIDAGIFKVIQQVNLLPEITPSELVKCMILNYTSEAEIASPTFINSCRYKIAGGFFLASSDNMIIFCDKILACASEYLNNGYFGLEQEFMAIVYVKNKELFDPYYGDFADLLTNYKYLHHNYWLPYRVFNTATDDIDKDRVCKYLLKSYNNNTIDISPEDIIKLLKYDLRHVKI